MNSTLIYVCIIPLKIKYLYNIHQAWCDKSYRVMRAKKTAKLVSFVSTANQKLE